MTSSRDRSLDGDPGLQSRAFIALELVFGALVFASTRESETAR